LRLPHLVIAHRLPLHGLPRRRWLAELTDLGYRDRNVPVALSATPVGRFDREAAAETAVARLSAARSAWNAADVRGEVERLIASFGIVVDTGVRVDLAEDVTFRALDRCEPLLSREGTPFPVPEHIRAWTSRSVLDVEADLTARLAARVPLDACRTPSVQPATAPGRLNPGQAAAVATLSGTCQLVVVEGAAGAGKTTTLVAARTALKEQGCRLVVVTPTLKAAKVASAEVGADAGSAAALAFAYGWRWTSDGAWTRLTAGEADPLTGRTYTGPPQRLRPGDLLVVDGAGMLDQDTARALLTVADECNARVALLGDRHQLAAVGRGGVLDLAVDRVDPAAHAILDGVHRFLRTDPAGRKAPDTGYADLTLAMRTGDDAGAVFDALVARGQIRLHPDASALQEAVATIATASSAHGGAAADRGRHPGSGRRTERRDPQRADRGRPGRRHDGGDHLRRAADRARGPGRHPPQRRHPGRGQPRHLDRHRRRRPRRPPCHPGRDRHRRRAGRCHPDRRGFPRAAGELRGRARRAGLRLHRVRRPG